MANVSPDSLSINPVNDHPQSRLTGKQSNAYNILLTQLAKVTRKLQDNVMSNPNLDKHSNAVVCWQYLLNDIATMVLPELYVVFHDRTTVPVQRRRLYDVTQAIYFAIVAYDTPIFLQKIALCDIESTSANVPPSLIKSYQDKQVDSYVKSIGDNVKVALTLRAIADYIDVDGSLYIDNLESYYNLLLSEKNVLKYLQNNTLTSMQETLRWWQKRRLAAFSFPKQGVPIPSHLSADHPLADWMFTHHLNNADASASDHELDTYKPVGDSLIANPQSLKKGIKFGVISLVLFSMASNSGIGFILFGLGYLITTIISAYSLSDAINYQRYLPAIKQYNSVAIVLAIVALFFGGLYSGAALTMLATSFFVYKLSKNPNNPNNKAKQLPDTRKQPPPLMNRMPQKTNQAVKPPQDFETIKKTAVDIEPEPLSKNYDLPLDINRHGYHLAILLSHTPTEHLKQLIAAANKLYDYLDYLQQAHPYLATRVDELVKDLAQNTIVRLDELASQFVNRGQVNNEAREVFIEQHEKRVDNLIVLNLEQVNALNKTILEKQMAGFAHIGNALERQFRDSVMELKILLRWLIAQQPDEVQASNHEVVLENLETTTLVDMQAAFFASETTPAQRGELQSQIEALIGHFKQQTPQSIQQYSQEQEEQEIQDLLQLSQSKANIASNSGDDLDSASTQSKTQQFIDFNEQYVKQLLKHWH